MRDDWDMSDSLIRALREMRVLRFVEDGVADEALDLAPYAPTLPGVSYDSTQNRLRAQVHFKKPRRRCVTLGSGKPTREDEERLHALYLWARAMLDSGCPVEELAARVKEAA